MTGQVQVDEVKLRELMFGPTTKWRDELFEFVQSDPLFRFDYNSNKESQRQVAISRLKRLTDGGWINIYTREEKDFGKWLQISEALELMDNSMMTLSGAQFVLFAGSIRRLGTEIHHQFVVEAEKMQILGCFAMTELGHGSNVRGLETTATFDVNTDEFIIHTPSDSAQKYWIGGGLDAHMATVFAQLNINNVNYGVHAFLVPLRDRKTNFVLPNIKLKDCGHKLGINGVSNGRFWFDHVRIPRAYLLNRFGNVTRSGEYESTIADNDTRFAATLANLLVGRVGLVSGATSSSKVALQTAIRYAFTRRQFGPPNGPETPIIEYTTTQIRLLPMLATTYAHIFITRRAAREFAQAQQSMDMEAIKNSHLLLSGLKAVTTWHNAETLALAREACGGQGMKSSNRIGILMADTEVMKTYEGDNLVLLQGLARDLMKKADPRVAALRSDLEIRDDIKPSLLIDAGHQLRIFHLREADLVAKLSSNVQTAIKNGSSPGEAMQTYALLAVDAAKAHTERIVFENFIKVEQESGVSAPLGLLRSLYAVYRFDRDASFLRHQYFSITKVEAFSRLLVQLCGQVKQIALPMVNAFAIPDFLLGEIANDWVAANSFTNDAH